MHRYSKYLHPLVLAGDLVMINVLILGTFSQFYNNLAPSDPVHLVIFVSVNVSWVISSLLFDSHKISRTANFLTIVFEIVCTILLNLLIISSGFYFLDIVFESSFSLVKFYGCLFVIVCGWRSLFLFLIHVYRRFGFNFRTIAVIGNGSLAQDLISFLEAHPEYGFKYEGYFDDSHRGQKFLGNLGQIKRYLMTKRIDELYCFLSYLKDSDIRNLIEMGEQNFIKIKIVSTREDIQLKSMDILPFKKLAILEATSFPLEHKRNKIYKRAFDIIFSLLVLITLGWMFLIIAVAIKIESRGPVFFVQRRTGKGNNKFWCLKFRTMYMNEQADKIQATKNDRRVTRIGAILRKNSLDELPQFFNVLIGNMSVVGPRPYMIYHTKKYCRQLDKFMARYLVRPGITGLAQCSGYRGEITNYISLKNRLKLDYFYISKWSFLFDFGIIRKTVLLLLRGDEKAY